MRLKQKYKLFKQLKHWKALDYIPVKLFASNKKSWKTFLSTYSQIKNNKLVKEAKLSTNSIVNIRRWDFNRKSYKNGVELKRAFYHIFDSIIRNKTLKRIRLYESKKYKQNNFINNSLYLIKPNFRLDILLWSLGFTNSVYEARNLIFSRNLYLNKNRNANPNNQVKTGDIISVKFNKELTFKKLEAKKINFKNKFNFFCEVDYYTKNIIIISDFLTMLHSYENPQVFYKKLDIRKFVSYLRREY